MSFWKKLFASDQAPPESAKNLRRNAGCGIDNCHARTRNGRAITTTGQLTKIVAGAVTRFEPGQNPATRTFQALRIHVNQELEELAVVLPQCVALLGAGGRLVVISFHSLEDRLVKNAFRDDARFLPLTKKPIRPNESELFRNPRSRSARLRVAQRTDASIA